MLKTTHTEESSDYTNLQSCKIQLESKKKHNFKHVIKLLKPVIIDSFSTHSYIVDICKIFLIWSESYFWKHLFLFRVFLIMKTTFQFFSGIFENPAPAAKTSCKLNIIFKKLWNISYTRMRRKIIYEYRLQFLNDLFGIKFILYDPSRVFQLSEFVWTLYVLWYNLRHEFEIKT